MKPKLALGLVIALALVAGVATAARGTAATDAMAATTTVYDWAVERSLPQGQSLYGVTCPSETMCKAVGSGGVILSWDGTNWFTHQSGTTLALRGVSCPTTAFCKAVGQFGTIRSWNGAGWSGDTVNPPPPALHGVSCVSTTFCKAVGDTGTIVSWNGTSWSTDSSGTGNVLRAISCATASSCKAVGESGTILSWNGSNWSPQSSGTTMTLHGVSCPTATLCKAVGDSGTVRSWNGTSWTTDTFPLGDSPRAVHCPATTLCIAVGANGLVASWNGGIWALDRRPTTQPLSAVSCPTTALCKAVGDSETILGMVPQTLTNVDPGFVLDLVQIGCLRGVTVTQTDVNHPNATPAQQTGKYWSITAQPAGCTSGYLASLILPTSFIADGDASVCRYTGTGTDWDCALHDYTASSVARGGITQFSDWAAAAFADTQTLPFSQDWSNTDLIYADDDWSMVSGIKGYRGDGMTSTTGVDPQTVTADGSGPVDVNANEWAPDCDHFPAPPGGVAEFDRCWLIQQAVVALKGDATARAPHLVIALDTTSKSAITVRYLLVDIGENGNSIQPVALQYRVGNFGPYTNVPAGFVADASCTCLPSGQETPVSATLPAAANNQPLVNVRIITTDAAAPDEWIAIDNISISSQPPTAVAVQSFSASRTAIGALIRWDTGSEVDTLGFSIIRSGGGTTVKLNRSLITASTSGRGASYRFVDRTAKPGTTYIYRLQAVSLRGAKTFLATSRLAG